MKTETLYHLLLVLYAFLGLIAIIDIPHDFQTINYILDGNFVLQPEKYWLKVIFELSKVSILLLLIYNYSRRKHLKQHRG